MFCGTSIAPLFALSSLTAEDTASVRGMHRIHSGGFSRPPATDAALLSALHIFVQLYTRSFQMICGTATIPLLMPAVVIDRGRCRFRARNAPHSFRRLLTLASKRCRSCRPRCIFSCICALSFNYSAARQMFRFLRPPLSLTAEDAASVCGILCIHSGGFSRPQASDAAPAVCATYFRTAVRCLLNVLLQFPPA